MINYTYTSRLCFTCGISNASYNSPMLEDALNIQNLRFCELHFKLALQDLTNVQESNTKKTLDNLKPSDCDAIQ